MGRRTSGLCADCGRVISVQGTRCKSCVNRLRWTDPGDIRWAKLASRNAAVRGGNTPYKSREWLRERYEDRQMSLRAIAAEAACGLRTIARWMEDHGLTTRPRGTHLTPMTGSNNPKWRGGPPKCGVCGKRCAFYAKVCAACHDRKAERGSNWHGDNVEYAGAHNRVVARRGQPSLYSCEHCGKQAAEWAYDHADPNEKRNQRGRSQDGPFSLDINHYMPLCVKCHRGFDKRWWRVPIEDRPTDSTALVAPLVPPAEQP